MSDIATEFVESIKSSIESVRLQERKATARRCAEIASQSATDNGSECLATARWTALNAATRILREFGIDEELKS